MKTENVNAAGVGSDAGFGPFDYPSHEGRWLVETDEGNQYEADVREYAPSCFEALVHGYALDWDPVVCLPRFKWTALPNDESKAQRPENNL